MKGEYFMTQHDLQEDTVKYDAVGMGSYNIDVRHVQRTWIPVSRFPDLAYEVYSEGYISIPAAPYEIPYRSLLPKYEQCRNLIVPVCISASAIAYASVRMEPQYMIMGQAAGLAAAMAAREDRAVHRIDLAALQEKLLEQGQILSLKDNTYGAFGYGEEIIIDNNMKRFTSKSGTWRGIETDPEGRYQMNYAQNDAGEGRFSFKPWLAEGGLYELSIRHPAKKNYSPAATILVNHKNGMTEKQLDLRKDGGVWIPLGRYEFGSGTREVLSVMADGAHGTVVADAIKLKIIH